MWRNTAVSRRFDLAAPIVQGPFGGGLSSVALVAAVCDAGGLGSFGVHHLSGAEILAVAVAIRQRTQRPFALNVWIPPSGHEQPALSDADYASVTAMLAPYFKELGLAVPAKPSRFAPDYNEQVEALLEARPAVFSFVYGIPSAAIIARCRDLEITTFGTATTPDEARALEAAGIDFVVATGFEAGGHRVSFLKPPDACLTGTFALIPQVVDAVKIPVIAAGGIADGRGVAAALTLGAQGVQIGTAFLACEESAANPQHKALLFSSAAYDTALTRAFSGRLARGIRNRFMEEMRTHDTQIPDYPIHSWWVNQFKAVAFAQGRTDLVSLWSGQAAPLLRYHHAGELMNALQQEADAIFAVRA